MVLGEKKDGKKLSCAFILLNLKWVVTPCRSVLWGLYVAITFEAAIIAFCRTPGNPRLWYSQVLLLLPCTPLSSPALGG